MPTRPLLVALAALSLILVACSDQKVTAYRVPKEKDPQMPGATAQAPATPGAPAMPAAAGAGMASTPVPTASGAALVWTAPATWKTKTGSSMRKGSYAVGETGAEADLSITAFPGDVGGEVANVNRWRGQVSLPPLPDAEVAGAVTRLSANGLALTIVDFSGTGSNAQRILGAIVPFGEATWFFKLIGPEAVVAKAREDFLAFVKTVKAAPAP